MKQKWSKIHYEHYLNTITDISIESDEWIIGGKHRTGQARKKAYGTALRHYDPIAFEVGRQEWIKENEKGAYLRSNIIEHYGMNAIMETLDYDVVDVNTIDGRYYRLLNVLIPDFSGFSRNRFEPEEYRGLYLEMINPSTGESHFEGVANVGNRSWEQGLKEATVLAALAWRDNDISSQTTENWSSDSPDSETYVKPVILK